MANIAINGLGRIGRAAFKILEQADGAEVVAVNDLIPPDNLAYLLRYDTVYGRWHTTVTADGDALVVGGRKIPELAEQDPASLPWKTLGVDLVLECTGAFRREEDLKKHLSAGARRVILSAPARTETVATVVHGVNQASLDEQVISCASCTTNCITPVAEVLDRRFGIRQAIMTTVHAYTSSSPVAPAARSPRAAAKAAAKHTPAGLPVHSLTSLLADLATICLNQIQPADPALPGFQLATTPTPPAVPGLDLLGVSHRLGIA
jgi:glyceraldehyde 3-phosphate dehydrogenase